MLQAINFNRLAIAVAAIAIVATAGFLSTRAFFSDTETSAGNVFAAGSLDLMVGIYAPQSLWPDVAPRNNNNQQLFAINNIMPGEKGEGYFRLLSTEDSWACMSAELTATPDNTRLSQEESAGDTTPNIGELQDYMQIAVWETNAGNNDGLVGPNEVDTLKIMSLADFTNGEFVALQDSVDGDNPLVDGTEYQHEFAYCLGEFVGTPGNMASYVDSNNELTCDGGAYGSEMNRAQTDGVELLMSFYAEQSTNNANFICSSLNGTSTPPVAASYSTGFEPTTFTVGNINGQDGWEKTGPYDAEVTSSPVIDGVQSLRISNAVTTGAFGDQTFAPELSSGAGETGVGTENHFEAEFKISSTNLAQQPGLALSVSPDDGNGSRMSYLGFVDEAGGIRVTFYDVTNPGPLSTISTFNPVDLGLLDRSASHTIKFEMDFVDGPSNDVVRIYIDGSLVHTGTSWENYFRYDPEQLGNGNVLSPVDTLIFRAGGTAAPGTAGGGYLFDNVTLSSSTI